MSLKLVAVGIAGVIGLWLFLAASLILVIYLGGDELLPP